MPQATTIRRAKAQYRKSGPQLAPAEQKRVARAVQLDKRRQATKEREQRRKKAEKARVERQQKEQEARKQLGIGLATQLVGYSLSQKQMKGGMEGWLGGAGKKRKRSGDEDEESEEKENRAESSCAGEAVKKREEESFGSNMSLDEILLEQLNNRKDSNSTSPEAALRLLPAAETATSKHQVPETTSDYAHTPPAKRVKTLSSPNDSWAQYLDGNTQILQDISQSPPRLEVQSDPVAAAASPPMSTQDLEINSDDLFETGLPKTRNPVLNPKEGVVIRDFAVFEHAESGEFMFKAPNAPPLSRRSRTEKSILRSFGRKPTIATPSPKMTANCATFTAAQCSFTSDYHHYGLSTQMLQQALDDGDDDTEDEDEEVYSQALANSKIPDKVLMPPPPLRLSPKVFKPPVQEDVFATKGGLQIFGLSTQALNDAITADDDDLTDEDDDAGLFNVPLQRTTADDATATTTIVPVTAHASSSATRYKDSGLSTQVLQDAASDDIDFTDDEDTQRF
jgi:hypothetical protein